MNMKISLLTIIAAAGITLIGCQIDYASYAPSVLACVLVWAIGRYCDHKGWKRASGLAGALGALTAASIAAASLTYGLGALKRPYIDATLAAIDAWFGLSASETVTFVGSHPLLHTVLAYAYGTMGVQTLLVVLCVKRPQVFLTRMILGALVMAACFAFWPAQGSCVYFNLPVPDYYAQVLRDLDGLQRGQVINLGKITGIVTFPSFHTIWAVLLAAAFWPTRLRWPALALNGLVIASVVPIGMHYYADLAAGILIAAIALALTRRKVEVRPGDAPCQTSKTNNSSNRYLVATTSPWPAATTTGP